MFHRLAASILASVMALSVVTQAQEHSATREAPKSVRSKLFKQVMADFAELRDCLGNEAGGVSAAEENLSAYERDLNGDGAPEYEVGISGPCDCGMVNCSIWLYRQSLTGYELILDGASGFDLNLLKSSTNS